MRQLFLTSLFSLLPLAFWGAETSDLPEMAQMRMLSESQLSSFNAQHIPAGSPVESLRKKAAEHRYAAPADMLNIEFALTSPEDYSISLVVALKSNSEEVAYVADQKTWGVAEIPAGEYDFLFWGESEEEPYYFMLLSEQNVTLEKDGTYLVDFSKSTERVEFQPLLPDGQQAATPLINMDSDTTVEKGNLEFGVWTSYVFMDSLLIDFPSGRMDRGIFDDGWSFDDAEKAVMYINPSQTNISIVHMVEMVGDADHNGVYLAHMTASPAQEGVYSNDISDYNYLKNEFVLTCAESREPLYWPLLYTQCTYRGELISHTAWGNNIGKWPYSVNYWISNNDMNDTLGLSFYLSPAVIGTTGKEFANGDDNFLGILSDPVNATHGSMEFMAIPNTFNSLSDLRNYNKFQFDNRGQMPWKTNPFLDYSVARKKIADGNSAPILVAEQCWYNRRFGEAEELRNVLYHTYKGRNGEVRSIDLVGETITVSINDKAQDISDYGSLHAFTRNVGTERYGNWDIEIVDNNCYVNGMKGYNSTKIHFNDSGDDVCAPTLQMMQTLDAEGNITDTFASAEDGKIVIVGGDFNTQYSDLTGEYFDVSPCSTKIECAPIDSEAWVELQCNEIEDRFMMPGWGFYWEAPLNTIATPSTDTQYSLRITLTDASGNFQQQTLGPVFTIKAGSGIAKLGFCSEDAEYFTLQGLPVLSPVSGQILIERSHDGSVRKVMMR